MRILELSKDATVGEDNGPMLGFGPGLKGFVSELGRAQAIHSQVNYFKELRIKEYRSRQMGYWSSFSRVADMFVFFHICVGLVCNH